MSEDVVADGTVVAAVGDSAAELVAVKARLVQSELRAAAAKAGIIDLDCVKLIDVSKVVLNSAGEVEGAGRAIAGMRAAKPWLFSGSSSSVAAVPVAVEAADKPAMKMSTEEWRKARAALLRR